ncbi:apoptosis regulator BAX-like isoform X2 [Talpa occidentalis]|uniref:apoptosis regulator BAX-like isoform X2 n=1 Tax=Talpa occidentalis TaxID=50954 RepID=UPI0023F8017D|nr:apoptosis regulator BAX-like isoform X2 [Talpa occidentalis]
MEQIMETVASLLKCYICDEIGPAAKDIDELGPEPESEDIKKLRIVLKLEAQKVDIDKMLQRSITALEGVHTAANFFQVAGQIISDGITWGRVAALFCLASKLALQTSNEPNKIKNIMVFTLDLFREQLLPWIQEQGGWDGLLLKMEIHLC